MQVPDQGGPASTVMTERKSFRVVVFRGQRHWVAQCLEIDLAAQAERLEDLPERLARTFAAEVELARERGVDPFLGLPQAPARYWAMWRGSEPVQEEAAPWERFAGLMERLAGLLIEPHVATASAVV